MIAIVLINPKSAVNVGGVIRAASTLGADKVFWTGTRVSDGQQTARYTGTGMSKRKWRLPREERMKAYDIEWGIDEGALDRLVNEGFKPVCVELLDGAQNMHNYVHPLGDTVYVFGPEDGDVPKGVRHFCHEFVQIPSKHCLNLAASVNITLYDRGMKNSYWAEMDAALAS
jgi:tRNA(Leu) C34 or U34 (ribose-2'-O)-methylase TrmL